MSAPRGTLCVLNQIHEHIFVKREDNCIRLHDLLEKCDISSADLDTVLDYLGSRGAITGYKRNDRFEIEINAHPGLAAMRDLIKAEQDRTRFEYDTNVLVVGERKITFGAAGKNYATDLLRTIFRDPKREWANDEIYEDWQYNNREREDAIRSKRIYQAARNINEKAHPDFLAFSTKSVQINAKYLA